MCFVLEYGKIEKEYGMAIECVRVEGLRESRAHQIVPLLVSKGGGSGIDSCFYVNLYCSFLCLLFNFNYSNFYSLFPFTFFLYKLL